VLFQRAGLRHNLEKVSGKNQRARSKEAELAPEMARSIKRMLGKG
jgi:large subunit ribosomal protein L35